jgi:hypothetical protein
LIHLFISFSRLKLVVWCCALRFLFFVCGGFGWDGKMSERGRAIGDKSEGEQWQCALNVLVTESAASMLLLFCLSYFAS